ncbi:ras and Rab interactor 2 isoform X1 [Hypomesus transpacificus]|uniref:ras and Rab interactor 2 isoform X1 n=1 Tax=Hypomesus transpacificus TaxID=137520 RepID=UPI001F07EE44|nr:ras and Rab interactor 2 isoform X1 [Hypomesus transpacificus]
MSADALGQPCQRERKGSFFKLIDSFAWEIGTLKKEMVQKAEPAVRDPGTVTLQGLQGEVACLFQRSPPSAGIGTGPARARDSGYDSLHRLMSVLDRLIQTHGVWLQLGLNHADATRILQSHPPGTFLVRKSTTLQRKVISLRMDPDSETPVRDFPVKESQYTFSLEGSGLSFADLFRLVAFCCISRDVLPFTLKLPEAISSAKTPSDLQEVAKLGAGFWDSDRSRPRTHTVSWLSGVCAQPAAPAAKQRAVSTDAASHGKERPLLRTRTPSELECCQSNGALCFINPLFLKVHHPEGGHRTPHTPPTPTKHQRPAPPVGTIHHSPENLPSSAQCPGDEHHKDSLECPRSSPPLSLKTSPGNSPLRQSPQHPNPDSRLYDEDSSELPGNCESICQLDAATCCPPPRPLRPPPPRLPPRRPAPPCRQRSMPEKISWINPLKEGEKEKGGGERTGSLLSRLGSSLSISPSSSPPKRLSISSPISIPRPSLPLSLASLSTSPRRPKPAPSPCRADLDSHEALDDRTIENAVSLGLAKMSRRNVADEGDPEPAPERLPPRQEGVAGEGGRGGGGVKGGAAGVEGGCQRLSDMSLSTDSSDSLDFTHGFFPQIHDPSPPTAADYSAHLPLSLPPPPRNPDSSMEDEDEEEEDEEQDDGVSLESDQDQDQDLTITPPGHRTKRRASAGALVIQRAFRGHLRKMSGVFSSLLTPEKRAVRRVLELARDKGSYFGCLVQDYLSYLQEGGGSQAWQCHSSGLELLQTLRQFITQMKSYLRQSSELEPPIETLIPEDQIDQVLEKAMHKCVLKPLKGVVGAALQEFQVRSGGWQELKENLSLAKARQPREMGVADALPPDPVAIEKIRHKFHTMCKLYSPEKKVTMLLRVCKLIYTIMEDNSGRLYGADDFLPMLTYVLAQCDMPQLDNEILYMMELLDPSLLNGEGGYYLTSAYGAMSLIRNFQEEQAARILSSETRNTLHQWHRRRTTQRLAPSVDDFQNYLRVALQELDSGCTAKTLLVRPYSTAEEVCKICAEKFKVSDPENYALFLLTEGTSQQLAPDTHPQKIKAEVHSRAQSSPFHFVFRRVITLNESSAAPLDLTLNLNELAVTSDLQSNLNDLTLTTSKPHPNLNLGLSPSLGLSLPPNQHNGNSISI